MIDPYQVLGISKNATEDEIKKAYRKKAKEYHPDLHPNDPVAAKKMNEVNEAYDMLKNPEKYERKRAQEQQQNAYRQQSTYNSGYGSYQNSGSQSYSGYGYSNGGYGSGGYSGGFYGFNFDDLFRGYTGYSGARYDTRPHIKSGDSPEIISAINAINSGRYAEAIRILSAMSSDKRNARWYYLSAVAYNGSGNAAMAYDMIQKAYKADPNNQIYQQLLRQYQQSSSSDSESYYSGSSGHSIFRIFGIMIIIMLILGLFRGCMFFPFIY